MDTDDCRKAWMAQTVRHIKTGTLGVVTRVRDPGPHEAPEPHITITLFDEGFVTWNARRFLDGFSLIPDEGESRADPYLGGIGLSREDPYFSILEKRANQYVNRVGAGPENLRSLLAAVERGEWVRVPPLDPRVARYTNNPLPWIF
ncbi:hypothetical protein [Acidithiobacillus sp.]|uniref:hypothetical protein n=1 Tax=Acidithiobacillus sp. TaxID=1872118 RepID=UPI003D094D7A